MRPCATLLAAFLPTAVASAQGADLRIFIEASPTGISQMAVSADAKSVALKDYHGQIRHRQIDGGSVFEMLPSLAGIETWLGGISADGRIVVGQILYRDSASVYDVRGFRWSPGEPTTLLTAGPFGPSGWYPEDRAASTNGDGSQIVGNTAAGPVRWQSDGTVLPFEDITVAMNQISRDSRVAAGTFKDPVTWAERPIRFASEGIDRLAPLPIQGIFGWIYITAMTPDGRVMVLTDNFEWGYPLEQYGFLWSVGRGYQQLPSLLSSAPISEPKSISTDGRIVVGASAAYAVSGSYPELQFRPVIWINRNVSDIGHVLQIYGVTTPMPARSIAMGISDDGRTVVGHNRDKAWVATLPADVVAYSNCDGSVGPPALTPADFACFLSSFREDSAMSQADQRTAYTNCDGSTTSPILTPADFACFLQKYRAGQ